MLPAWPRAHAPHRLLPSSLRPRRPLPNSTLGEPNAVRYSTQGDSTLGEAEGRGRQPEVHRAATPRAEAGGLTCSPLAKITPKTTQKSAQIGKNNPIAGGRKCPVLFCIVRTKPIDQPQNQAKIPKSMPKQPHRHVYERTNPSRFPQNRKPEKPKTPSFAMCPAFSSFRNSSFFRHSSFALRHLALASSILPTTRLTAQKISSSLKIKFDKVSFLIVSVINN